MVFDPTAYAGGTPISARGEPRGVSPRVGCHDGHMTDDASHPARHESLVRHRHRITNDPRADAARFAGSAARRTAGVSPRV
ncbi:MAG: hypothetical protein CMJ18_21605, partial [Phycisphaeraceae bacterium]|nr:hypothetical protein [Phycisphaeraceae bacterium]